MSPYNSRSQSESPFKVDGDRPLRMKIATLALIIITVATAVGYGLTLKQDVAQHGKQLETLVQRQTAIEIEARAQHDLSLETKASLRLMDAKLDYIAGGRRGPAPTTSVP